ncbi:putative cysteine--tRNA ligase, mitochondrial [Hypsibius exemplaris]|uniref:cysteine--tRNA ligase n=1 Tax=Hypsibius exemplaris TaxID=2072580 RepID=A0A1W0W8F7_HYPEX|nr:putative cysteine--tRNA ligase, mitochondrial [Hypsibius exemplaris]
MKGAADPCLISSCLRNAFHQRIPHFLPNPRRLSSSPANSSAENLSVTQVVTNSLTRTKEAISMANPPVLRWYSCGPTVYDSAHLGHAYSFMQFDLIRRVLEDYRGLNVVQVMNITDIDDKIIHKANQLKMDWREVARNYEDEFREEMRSLGIKPPTITARITSFLPQIVGFTQKLIDSGMAYVAPSGSVYFSQEKYGRASKFIKSSTPEGFDKSEKKSGADFALWKGAKAGEPSWPVPFSPVPGRPGWHIECSTVASHFFGSSVDLHSGGIDLMFPHHENEEAQCCAHHGVDNWAGQWIHAGHLLAPNATKMSKSDRNFITIRSYLERSTSDQFRMYCMRHHYRSNCTFDDEEIRISSDLISKFTNFCNLVDAYLNGVVPASCSSVEEPEILQQIRETERQIDSCLADDFSYPFALQALSELVSICHRQLAPLRKSTVTSATSYSAMAAAANLTETFFRSAGLVLPTKRNAEARTATAAGSSPEAMALPKVMDAVLDFRSVVRGAGLSMRKETPALSKEMLGACDGLRDRLQRSGVRVKDLGGGSTWELEQQVPVKVSAETGSKVGSVKSP